MGVAEAGEREERRVERVEEERREARRVEGEEDWEISCERRKAVLVRRTREGSAGVDAMSEVRLELGTV